MVLVDWVDLEKSMSTLLRREQVLRLFQQLHQTSTFDGDPDFWYRANGGVRCKICGLQYREHFDAIEFPMAGDTFDKRLCDGTIVHL